MVHRGQRAVKAPPWWAEVVVEEGRYRELQDEMDRCRARRSLMIFLGYRYFGVSTRWLGEKLGISHVRVQRLVEEGKTVAMSGVAEGDLEELVRMIWDESMVGLGWDGAGSAG